MPKTMISLIGEQPIPNILPVRSEQPDEIILAHTGKTKEMSRRLGKILSGSTRVQSIEIPAYDLRKIAARFRGIIVTRKDRERNLSLNLTGGTKPMVLGLYQVATELEIPFLYFQTEGMESKIYEYRFDGVDIRLRDERIIKETIRIEEYLNAFLDDFKMTGFSQSRGGAFERAVYKVLAPEVDEICIGVKKGALDIDLVIRRVNQVAIIEVKSGEKARRKGGIDQLNTAASREFLGIYTRKVLAIDRRWDETRSNLRELAEAHNIMLLEFPSFSQKGEISEEERDWALERIDLILGGSRTRAS